MWGERSRELLEIFDLSNWKDRVALIEMGKPGKSRFEGGDRSILDMLNLPIGHPDVGLQYCFTVLFLKRNNGIKAVYAPF